MNYYRRYVGDYLKKTIRLTMAGHGAYGLMLDFYYAEEKALPLDMDDIYAIARAASDDDRRIVDKVLASYFQRRPDGYHNERADEELGIALPVIGKQRQAGIDTANKRWGNRSSTNNESDSSTDSSSNNEANSSSGSSTNRSAIEPPTTNHHPPTTTPQPLSTIHQPGSKTKAARPIKSVAVLPDWLPAEPWAQFVEMRRQKRKLMTDKAVELIHKKLAGFRVDGEDLAAVLLQSVENGWTGVFPVKPAGNGGNGADIQTANERAAQTWVEDSQAPPVAAALNPPNGHDLPSDFIADFLNSWASKLGVTQGADESDPEHHAAVVSAIEVEARSGNGEAVEWLEQYGEQAKAMVPA